MCPYFSIVTRAAQTARAIVAHRVAKLCARVCISGINASGKRHDPHAILFEADEDDVNVNVVSHLG